MAGIDVKDDQNPIVQDLDYRKTRVINVLENLLEKIEITYCLEMLFVNKGAVLADHLSRRDYCLVMDLYHRNVKRAERSSSKFKPRATVKPRTTSTPRKTYQLDSTYKDRSSLRPRMTSEFQMNYKDLSSMRPRMTFNPQSTSSPRSSLLGRSFRASYESYRPRMSFDPQLTSTPSLFRPRMSFDPQLTSTPSPFRPRMSFDPQLTSTPRSSLPRSTFRASSGSPSPFRPRMTFRASTVCPSPHGRRSTCQSFRAQSLFRSSSDITEDTVEMIHLREHHECCTLIATLHQNLGVMKYVEELSGLYPRNEFLTQMYEIKDLFAQMVHTSAREEKEMNQRIAKSWANNEKYKAKIEDIEQKRKIDNAGFANQVDSIKELIATYKDQANTSLHTIIRESERRMTIRSSVNRKKTAITFFNDQTERFMDRHLKYEKNLRKIRTKKEVVLMNAIAEYDEYMGKLQEAIDEEEEGYKKEKAMFEELKQKFAEQSKQYIILMKEKDKEDQLRFIISLWQIKSRRAIKTIERWWCKILRRRERRRKRTMTLARQSLFYV